jgi:hypothetical protein
MISNSFQFRRSDTTCLFEFCQKQVHFLRPGFLWFWKKNSLIPAIRILFWGNSKDS